MALTSSFLFTNTTDSTNSIVPKALGLTSNYAITTDTANDAVLNNKTAPLDAQEIISFRSRDITKINNNLVINHPAKTNAGIQYGVQVEETLVTTDSDDANFRLDEPIIVSISIRHPKSGNFTNAIAGTAVLRAVSALMKADGTWRFDDLMRSAEKPIEA